MKNRTEALIHAILWITGFLMIIIGANTLGVFHKKDGSIFLPVLIGTLINVIIFYSVSLGLIPRFSNDRNVKNLLWLILLLLFSATAIESLIDYLFFSAKFSTADEPFGSQLITNFVFNLIILSIALAYGFIKSWIRNERFKQKLKEEKLSAELDFLKAQINPHFLFNVLNMAYSSSISHGDTNTSNIIERLSGLMRYMLYESNSDKVEVTKEIKYIRDFINLQKLRISDDRPVKVNFNISGDYQTLSISPLILVPFIENAFKHGIKLEEESFINIDMRFDDSQINFKVSNSKFMPATAMNSKHSGVGLENVKKRLSIIYPKTHRLLIEDLKDSYNVELTINLM